MGDNKALEDALVSAVHEIFEGDREALSVNHVRKEVETDRGLPEGFFGSAEWKSKSKTIIKGRVVSVSQPVSIVLHLSLLSRQAANIHHAR